MRDNYSFSYAGQKNCFIVWYIFLMGFPCFKVRKEWLLGGFWYKQIVIARPRLFSQNMCVATHDRHWSRPPRWSPWWGAPGSCWGHSRWFSGGWTWPRCEMWWWLRLAGGQTASPGPCRPYSWCRGSSCCWRSCRSPPGWTCSCCTCPPLPSACRPGCRSSPQSIATEPPLSQGPTVPVRCKNEAAVSGETWLEIFQCNVFMMFVLFSLESNYQCNVC